jgi:hypothetical protein
MSERKMKVTHVPASQEGPSSVLVELVGVIVDGLHDGVPRQVDRTLGQRHVAGARKADQLGHDKAPDPLTPTTP